MPPLRIFLIFLGNHLFPSILHTLDSHYFVVYFGWLTIYDIMCDNLFCFNNSHSFVEWIGSSHISHHFGFYFLRLRGQFRILWFSKVWQISHRKSTWICALHVLFQMDHHIYNYLLYSIQFYILCTIFQFFWWPKFSMIVVVVLNSLLNACWLKTMMSNDTCCQFLCAIIFAMISHMTWSHGCVVVLWFFLIDQKHTMELGLAQICEKGSNLTNP